MQETRAQVSSSYQFLAGIQNENEQSKELSGSQLQTTNSMVKWLTLCLCYDTMHQKVGKMAQS